MAAKPRTPYEDTSVPVYKSREDIADLLKTLGATSIGWVEGEHPEHPGKIVVAVRFSRVEMVEEQRVPLSVRLVIAVPIVGNPREQAQLLRQHHRVLYWHLDAQVKAIQFGLRQFIEAFLPDLELPGGQTVFQQIGPQYLRGAALGDIKPLALLPGGE